MFEAWAREYGVVYSLPAALGSRRIALMDPKAISHFYARDTNEYTQDEFEKMSIDMIAGKGLLWADGESHKRQRKLLAPAFSNAAIRQLTSIFTESAYKLKAAWETVIESNGSDEAIIEVQKWLDSIGLAGFSHDFATLRGKRPVVATIFDSFANDRISPFQTFFLVLAPVLPFIIRLPNQRSRQITSLTHGVGGIADEMLERTRKVGEGPDRSIIGLLLKAEGNQSELYLSQEEIMAQMKILILAGYETTSISLTWALIELCRSLDVQAKLREELMAQFGASDPTWDQLTYGLPYLDAVVHEILRLHPPVPETNRMAMTDDVLPLTTPIVTKDGKTTDRVAVAKGTTIVVPIHAVNVCEALWGPDAKEFKPERWLEDGVGKTRAAEIAGHRHLLTFVDGPRTCLGKGFAIAEFKAVLSVLVRGFAFELGEGPGTRVETTLSLFFAAAEGGGRGGDGRAVEDDDMAAASFRETDWRALIAKLTTLVLGGLILFVLSRLFGALRARARSTRLRGPANQDWVFGFGKIIRNSEDAAGMYEGWASKYGVVYSVPAALGSHRVVLMDPKAISHFYARDTNEYTQDAFQKLSIEKVAGRGLLWADGESHKRQRKLLTPAFSNAAIRQLTSIFTESAYKLKAAWEIILESNGSDEAIIEVQNWMNHISLDSIGLAGFSHDFATLHGKRPLVATIFESFANAKISPSQTLLFVLAPVLPFIIRLPNQRSKQISTLNHGMGEIADEMLDRTRKVGEGDKSIIGLLLKAEGNQSDLYLSQEEVMAQMKILILAGYETTSISLTWALIELCKHLDIQAKLREELMAQFGASDPTWDQLTYGLPYLDAVVHEILRLHPPVAEMNRMVSPSPSLPSLSISPSLFLTSQAMTDGVLPLTTPIVIKDGKTTDRVAVAKGTTIVVPIHAMNVCEVLWGPDAKEFKPERWLEDGVGKTRAAEIAGHRHLLTFVDGPRTCLGKGFAIAEFKGLSMRAIFARMIRGCTSIQSPGCDAHSYSRLPRIDRLFLSLLRVLTMPRLQSSFTLLTALISTAFAAISPVTDLHIANKQIAPDGFTRDAVLAGGTFPGPLISANKGDHFAVNVIDDLTDDTMDKVTSIHWHGIFQRTTNWADGPAFVNQCPIIPGHSFSYNFSTFEQTGTYWYHSHFAAQYCDGLRGPLVIYDPQDPYIHLYEVDNESTVITLADWYHYVSKAPGHLNPHPASTLINGLGRSSEGPALAPLAVVNVRLGSRYRFRLVSLSCDPNYQFSIDNHRLTIIEADGVLTEPLVVDELRIFAGQRYSVILNADQLIGNYWIRAIPSVGDASTTGGLNSAILRYSGALLLDPISSYTPTNPLNETNLHALEDPEAPGNPGPGEADVNINLHVTFDIDSGLYSVNGEPFVPPSVPVLLQILSGEQNAQALMPKGSVIPLPRNASVEVTVPSGAIGGDHSFSVVRSMGNDSYNYDNPVRRDVVNIGDGSIPSNVTIRFRTDNPGPWFLHCHIDWHLEAGFAIVFAEDIPDISENVQAPPEWNDLCPIYNESNEEKEVDRKPKPISVASA
ncbi:hypothetical protein EW146_g8484 [Bondarzewia mesenterica]|uniref:Laccase n=1 Tax=Bondarzewia mesenterica TaxID=1095465 RepID=A0A4S4LDY1_9AGAM|nr:hypothetical protein EW146_g8484 [Bondarzewia mesenterica]